ncbi:hypothetical protein B14911_10992 [Bacillus sp. NRRL B-14911]|nr:hypothetical protein B14911_10992 [Bacillus sp. NRRL B-14911]
MQKLDFENQVEYLNEQTSIKEKKIMNSPSNQVIEVSLDNETEIFEQQSFSFSSMETDLSPENLKEILARLNMSIRQAADEIGIANTTLSRYINRTKGKIRRMIRR